MTATASKSTRTTQASGAPAMSLTGLKISMLHPERGARFSPNLYAFMTSKKNKALAPRARAYRDAQGALHLGYFDDTDSFIGARMSQVLCNGAKTYVSCPVNLGPLTEVEDFWERYVDDGRCAVDEEHRQYFIGDETRWHLNGETRSCLWCGKATQRLITRLVTKEVSSWENA